MLKKIKKGVKRVMKESSEIVKYMAKSLNSTKSRINIGILGVCCSIGLIVSAIVEDKRYSEVSDYVEEN